MFTLLLLIIIYLAFISLGLPDSLLGVSWPAMRLEFGLPLDAAGIIAMVTIGMTIVSSLANGYIIRKVGTGKLTLFSCILTGGALLGISMAPSFWLILPLALALGFGAGSVDAGLNNYVAHHFKAHHMNWLHSFWGVGATVGPLIMGNYLLHATWRDGYRTIAFIQLILAAILFLSLPLWKRHARSEQGQKANDVMSLAPDAHPLRIKGVPYALSTFLFYVAAEMSMGLWGSSYLVQVKGISVSAAARWIAMYFAGIMIGRFLSGFISFKFTNHQMIRGGVLIALGGVVLLVLPLPAYALMFGFVIIGIGFAPIFPGMIHETPVHFGKNNSSVIIGFEMAAAYTGSAILPPLTGVLYRNVSLKLFPYVILILVILILFTTEFLRRMADVSHRNSDNSMLS